MKKFANIILFLVVTSVCLFVAEFVVRKVAPFSLNQDERNLSYDYDSELGWFPKKDFSNEFFGSRLIKVTHNKMGFRDIEHQPNKNPNIVVLGDSFVWGYDVEDNERLTDFLQTKFKNKFNIYNFGVSGYGTGQEFLLLQRYYDQLKPKFVFVIFCGNDFYDNTNNVVYGGYYKSYYVEKNGKLELRGIPVPISGNYKMLHFSEDHPLLAKSEIAKWTAKLSYRAWHNIVKQRSLKDPTTAILAEMNKYLNDRGSKLVVGTIDHHPELEEFLAKENITQIDLYNQFRYHEKGNHWTPEGHKFAADKIANFLNKNKK